MTTRPTSDGPIRRALAKLSGIDAATVMNHCMAFARDEAMTGKVDDDDLQSFLERCERDGQLPQLKALLDSMKEPDEGEGDEIDPANPGQPDEHLPTTDASQEALWKFLESRLTPTQLTQAKGLHQTEMDRRAGNDEPPDLPLGGRPTAGGTMTALRAADRLRAHDRALAADAKRGSLSPVVQAAKDRIGLEPNATGDGTLRQYQAVRGTPTSRSSATDIAALDKRVPGLSRLKVI